MRPLVLRAETVYNGARGASEHRAHPRVVTLTAPRASLGANTSVANPALFSPFAGLAFPSRLTSGPYFSLPWVGFPLALDAAKESLPRAVCRCPTCPSSCRVRRVLRRALWRDRRRRRARSRLAGGRSGPAIRP